jgi:hypothetical protein
MELIETIKALGDADELRHAIRAARERLRELRGRGRQPLSSITAAAQMRREGKPWRDIYRALNIDQPGQRQFRESTKRRINRAQRKGGEGAQAKGLSV